MTKALSGSKTRRLVAFIPVTQQHGAGRATRPAVNYPKETTSMATQGFEAGDKVSWNSP